MSVRAEFVRVLVSSMARHDVTHEMLAESCGRPRQHVTEWCSPSDEGRVPSALDVVAMPARVRADLRAWEASRDLCVVLSSAPDALSHGGRMAVLTRELSDVTRHYADALADNHVSAAERAELVRELREAADAIARAQVSLELECKAVD